MAHNKKLPMTPTTPITPGIQTLPMTPTTQIDFKLQSSRDIKIIKNHCVFYDLLIRDEIMKIIEESEESYSKYNYYKELFEDQYDDVDVNFKIDAKQIEQFFKENELKGKSEQLIPYFNSNDSNDTLFVIPTFFDNDENVNASNIELFKQNNNSYLRNHTVYKKFYNIAINEETSMQDNLSQVKTTPIHIYYLPCLTTQSTKNTESEYLKKLQKKLIKLQD